VSHLRAILRILIFSIWSGAGFVLGGLAHLLISVAPGPGVAMKRLLCRVWARGVALIIGLRIETVGTPPTPPYILVSNHVSYVDIITIMAASPGVFVAKSEVAGWPLLGPLSRVANTIFVDRASRKDVVRVNELIRGTLARGEGLIMFPEGTSSRGVDVLPFRSSLLEPAVQSGRPVHYASVTYTTPRGAPPADMAVCWWGDMTFGGHFYNLMRLPSVQGSVAFGSRTLEADDRHELARTLHDAVTESFRPVTDGSDSPTQPA